MMVMSSGWRKAMVSQARGLITLMVSQGKGSFLDHPNSKSGQGFVSRYPMVSQDRGLFLDHPNGKSGQGFVSRSPNGKSGQGFVSRSP